MTRAAKCSCSSLRRMSLITACKSDSAKEQDRLERAVSWIATVEEVGRAWSENRVPARYAERVFEEAGSQLATTGRPNVAHGSFASFWSGP